MLDGDSVNHTKQWIFGYKLHITASTGSLIVPLSADFTQADVQDNQIYPAITSSSLPQGVRYMTGDSGYDDDHNLYSLSIGRGFELVSPVSEKYNNTSSERLQLIHWGSVSVEPLIEHIRGFQNRSFTSKRASESSGNSTAIGIDLSDHGLLQLQEGNKQPKAIKHMLGS